MKLAVKFYKDVDYQPGGMPDNWPAEVLEIDDGQECPAGFVLMTPEEYAAHREAHMEAYLAWEFQADPKGLRTPAAQTEPAEPTLWERVTGWFSA